jgi:hypothetical protein
MVRPEKKIDSILQAKKFVNSKFDVPHGENGKRERERERERSYQLIPERTETGD